MSESTTGQPDRNSRWYCLCPSNKGFEWGGVGGGEGKDTLVTALRGGWGGGGNTLLAALPLV
jgi:hypothetical protein